MTRQNQLFGASSRFDVCIQGAPPSNFLIVDRKLNEKYSRIFCLLFQTAKMFILPFLIGVTLFHYVLHCKTLRSILINEKPCRIDNEKCACSKSRAKPLLTIFKRLQLSVSQKKGQKRDQAIGKTNRSDNQSASKVLFFNHGDRKTICFYESTFTMSLCIMFGWSE